MKYLSLSLGLVLLLTTLVYAEKTITVTLTDEEYKALSVLTTTPEQWVQDAVKNKAHKMIERLVEKYSDKNVHKISDAEKAQIINTIDLEKEKKERSGK